MSNGWSRRKAAVGSVKKPEWVARLSEDILARRLEDLRRCFPEAFVEGKVDFDRLRAALGDIVDESPERYTFTWAGKRNALRLLQVPTRATLLPCPEESIDWDTTQNVFIEGDNLEVLKLLLRPYYGRVKMIYIDPPYNTGNDFIYRDDYRDPLGAYLQMTGQKDEAGNLLTSNPETSGRYHSAWLSMMYPRLFLARQLLREDGVIFVSIDDHEVHNLRLVLDEIFGQENFLACIVWRRIFSPRSTAKHFSTDHDYLLAYARDAEVWLPRLLPRTQDADARYSNPDNDPRGPWTSGDLTARNPYSAGRYEVVSPIGRKFRPSVGMYWRVSYEKFQELDRDGRIWWGERGDSMPRLKRFLAEVKEGIVPRTVWLDGDVGHTQEAKKELLGLVPVRETENVLDTVKPPRLLRRLVYLSTTPLGQDLVVDFFAGSCTTAQAVLELNHEDGGNRRFVMVQLPELLPVPEEGFATVADLGKERIRRVIARLKEQEQDKLDLPERETPEDLGFRVYKLAPSNYRSWSGVDSEREEAPAPEEYIGQLEQLIDTLAEGWTVEGVIAEVALKEAGFGLNYKVEVVGGLEHQKVYRITDPDRDQFFYLCLDDEVCLEALKPLGLDRDTLFVCRASALDDETAANLALQCRLKVI